MSVDIPCALCERAVPDRYLERHHLVPRSKGGDGMVWMCCDCGNQIHILFTNNELRDSYCTIEALRSNSRVWQWVKWVRKQKNFGICMKKKKRKL